MARWARDEGGALCAEIDGTRYRARLRGRPPHEAWVGEFMVGDRWEQVGSSSETEAAAVADVEEFARHIVESAGLARATRSFARGNGTSTPWGKADQATAYGPGVTFYGTPSHGGFKVSKALNATVPDPLRNADGWYEEDSDWAKLALAFPHLFTTRERRQAEQSLRNWMPDAWEAHFGRQLAPGESMAKDDRAALARHARDWIVTAALASNARPGMVETWAKLGGDRNSAEERRFWVPEEEYRMRGRIGFVVDTARHEAIEEPTTGLRP